LQTGAQNYTDAVKGLVNSTFVFQSKNNSILVELPCEQTGKCSTDQRAFKGIFARTMVRAALSAPFVADSINKMLSTSAKAAASACTSGQETECSFSWADPNSKWRSASAKDGNLGEVYDVLEIVQGLLSPSAKGLKGVNASGSGNSNSTQNGTASKTSGSGAPQHTGVASSIATSFTAILAAAFAAVLSC
jgi:mannan endo-1,6-alpha-mannosidase